MTTLAEAVMRMRQACAVAGDAEGAERVWSEMGQRTNHFSSYVPPSSHTYLHLMAAQARHGPHGG